MKMKKMFLIPLIVSVLLGCEAKDPTPITPPVAAPEDSGATDKTDGEVYYLQDGDDPIYWVTNEYMQDFMAKVAYMDRNYTVSRIKDFPGGGPGEADIPPAVKLTWENNYPDKKLMLTVWNNDWSSE